MGRGGFTSSWRSVSAGGMLLAACIAPASCKPREEGAMGAPADATAAFLVDCDGGKVDLADDPANCGFCRRTCLPGHGTTGCVRQACKPQCDPGWAACSAPSNGCDRHVASDPRACGACSQVAQVVARDVPASGIRATDGTYVYFGRGPDTSKWSRMRLSDGKIEIRDDGAQFSPAAFDGKYLYGCRGHVSTGSSSATEPPCEVRRRVEDGPESVVGRIERPLWGGVMAVSRGTLYWARTTTKDTFQGGQGPYADVVATDLATKASRVVAARELAPMQMVATDTDLYWVTMASGETAGVRRASLTGEDVRTLATMHVAHSLVVHGDFVLASGVDGLFRVPRAGGPAELVLFGAPADVRPAGRSDNEIGGLAVVGDDLIWTVQGKEPTIEHVVRAPLAATGT